MTWEVKPLNKIGKIFSGNSINEKVKKEKYYNISEGFPYVATKDISYNYKIDYNNGVKIPQRDLNKFRIAHKNSILICSEGGSAGRKLAFNSKDICFVNKLFALEPFNFICPKYIFYFYNSFDFKKQFKSKMTGLIGGVSKNKFNEIKIPVPTLSEQKEIVKILDTAFEKIAKAKENVEINLKNSKEIFESYLNDIFENKGKDWEENQLSNIANFEYGYTGKSKNKGDYRYVRITDIDNNGNLTKTAKVYLESSKDVMNFIIKNNDLLMVRTGATFAKVLLYSDLEPSVFASYLIRIKFKCNIENKMYWYFSKSKLYWNQAYKLVSGSAQPHFNGNALSKINFIYPKSHSEQQKIISKLDQLSKQTKKLEEIYNKKLQSLEELKNSILEKAFKGELTKDIYE